MYIGAKGVKHTLEIKGVKHTLEIKGVKRTLEIKGVNHTLGVKNTLERLKELKHSCKEKNAVT